MRKMFLVLVIVVLGGCSLLDKEEDYTTFDEVEGEIQVEAEDVDTSVDYEEEEQTDEEYMEAEEGDNQYEEEDTVANIPAVEGPAHGKFAVLEKDCNVRWSPRGKKSHSLSMGLRLWVEVSEEDSDWYTVYTRKSLAYMHKGCFIEEE